VRPEGLGNLIKIIHLIGSRTGEDFLCFCVGVWTYSAVVRYSALSPRGARLERMAHACLSSAPACGYQPWEHQTRSHALVAQRNATKWRIVIHLSLVPSVPRTAKPARIGTRTQFVSTRRLLPAVLTRPRPRYISICV
jgi:hypothetical protein